MLWFRLSCCVLIGQSDLHISKQLRKSGELYIIQGDDKKIDQYPKKRREIFLNKNEFKKNSRRNAHTFKTSFPITLVSIMSTSIPLFMVMRGVSSSTGKIVIGMIAESSRTPSLTLIENLSSVVSVSSCSYTISAPDATSRRLNDVTGTCS